MKIENLENLSNFTLEELNERKNMYFNKYCEMKNKLSESYIWDKTNPKYLALEKNSIILGNKVIIYQEEIKTRQQDEEIGLLKKLSGENSK
jgi:hypothetical protein